MGLAEGIDVSFWQSRLPSNAGGFVFARGTYGEGSDSRVDTHVASARARGLFVGLYAFGVRYYQGHSSSSAVQAEALLRVADRLRIDRVALDWEKDGVRPQMTKNQAEDFIERVIRARGECGLYASAWQFQDFGQTWDWVAKWGADPPTWRNWEFWQYQGSPIDRNRFNGDAADLSAFFHRASPPAPKPVPRPQAPIPNGEDVMFNVGPITTHRDAVVKAGSRLYADSALKRRHSHVEEETPLGFNGSTGTAHIVINSGYTNFVRRSDVVRIVPNERHFE